MKKIFFATGFGLLAVQLSAQTQEGSGLNAGQVNVVQDYKPTLADAIKINTNPTINDSTPAVPRLDYSNINKTLITDFKIEPITPAKMKGEPLQKLNNNYVKVGFGNYLTSNAEAYLGSGRSKKMKYTFTGKNFSTAGSIKKYSFEGF